MQDSEEFKLVTRRKKRVPCVQNSCSSNVFLPSDDDSDSDINYETLFGKLLAAEVELKNSAFGSDVSYCLKDSLRALRVNGISEILCYGLGHFCHSRSSKYQLALLMSLKKHYGSQVYIYDPVFFSREIELLKKLGFNIIETNEEGKRIIHDNVTLVYMPHCSSHLTNNFLYANWNNNLNKCILLTNSFSAMTDDLTKTERSASFNYILRIRPYVTEIPLRNNFEYTEVFNNLNIHIFLERVLNTIPQSFWSKRDAPSDQATEADYLTAKQTEQIDAKNCNYVFLTYRSTFTNNVARKMKPNAKLIRSLIQEIRKTSYEQNVKNNIMVQYILEQARSHRETSEVLCKAREELKNLAETYLCYLNSQRMCKEIQARYTGKGERSIKETADLVGFKLPHDPK